MSCHAVGAREDALMDCSIIICFSSCGGSTVVLQRETRPTWAYPEHYIPALASSVVSMLLLLPCLAVGATTNGVVQADSFSMFCIRYGMDLGPLCTPAVLCSRRATLDGPDLTACLLARALFSLVWLISCDDAYERLVSLTLSSDSSATPA